MNRRQASVAFVLVTLFIDMLGAGLVVPILPKLVERLMGGALAEASVVYGLLIALYSLMQFCFAPMLGAVSDRFGRRPVILLALFGLGCDYVLLSVAPNLWWLVLGRLLAGIGGATITPAAAYIADVSPPEKRAANFGLIGVAFGLGFIAGPALGGLLGQADLRLPFVVAAGLSFVNLLFGLFVLPESLQPEHRRPVVLAQANPLGALRAVWRYPGVAALIPIFVAAGLAQQGLQSVWVPYTTYRYGWDVAEVGVSLAIVGLLFVAVQGVLVRPIVARFGEARTLISSLVVAVVGFVLFGLASTGGMMYAVTAGYILGLGLLNPAAQGLMSRAVPPSEQGLLQGALASATTAAAVAGPPLANGLFAYFVSPRWPGRPRRARRPPGRPDRRHPGGPSGPDGDPPHPAHRRYLHGRVALGDRRADARRPSRHGELTRSPRDAIPHPRPHRPRRRDRRRALIVRPTTPPSPRAAHPVRQT